MTGIHTIGQRVIVTDVQESLFWVRYKRSKNQLIIFANETHPRWVTTACLLDYDTMASADKFGNISIVCGRSLLFLSDNGVGYYIGYNLFSKRKCLPDASY